VAALRRRAADCALLLAFGLALELAATGAGAQSDNGDASGDPAGAGQRNQSHQRKPSHEQPKKVALPEIKVAPDPWPRLDPGAFFCRTAADLHQHLAAIEARLDGNPGAVAEPPGCSVILRPTAVVVVARDGLARTEVRLSNAPGETGWTDAFLPDKATGH
jgi:hypothetical protein